MFNRLNSREKIFLIIGILVLIIGIYYLYIYIPYSNNIDDLQETKENNLEEVNELKNKVNELPVLEREYEYLIENINQNNLISDFSSQSLSNKLVKLAQEKNVEISSYYPEERDQALMVETTLYGDFNDLISFIEELESRDRQLEFQKLDFTTDEDIRLELEFAYYDWSESGEIDL